MALKYIKLRQNEPCRCTRLFNITVDVCLGSLCYQEESRRIKDLCLQRSHRVAEWETEAPGKQKAPPSLYKFIIYTYIPNNPLHCCLQVIKQRKRSQKLNPNKLFCSDESLSARQHVGSGVRGLYLRFPSALPGLSLSWFLMAVSTSASFTSSHFWCEHLPVHIPHCLCLSNGAPWGVVCLKEEEEECHIVLWISPVL